MTSALDRDTLSDPPGPLADFDLDAGALDEALASAPCDLPPAETTVRSALPLFPTDAGIRATPPPRRTPPRDPAARHRPLGVRRQTPPVPRLRAPNRSAAVRAPGFEFGAAPAGAAGGATGPSRPVAAIPRRLGAGLVDAGLVGGLDLLVVALTARLAGLPMAAVAELPAVPLVSFLALLDLGYVVALTTLGGQTLGKMALGVRVVASDGSPATLRAVLIRTAGYAVSVLPAGLGLAGVLMGSGRAWHDRLAETDVVAR